MSRGEDKQFWMTAGYASRCGECEDDIRKGDRIVWDRENRKGYCGPCGTDLIGPDPQAAKAGDAEF